MEEPIFISLDTSAQNRHTTILQDLTNALKATNEAIITFIGGGCTLDKEILSTIKDKGYPHYINETCKREELKLKAAKLANLTVANMVSELREALTDAIETAFAQLSGAHYKEYFRFIGLHSNGNPYILDFATKEIAEMSSQYASSPEQQALYKAHLEAVKALNKLNATYFKVKRKQLNSMNFGMLFNFMPDNTIVPAILDYR